MEVMCYDSSSTRVFIQSEKKKKQPTRKTLQYTEMKLPDFGVYPFFP